VNKEVPQIDHSGPGIRDATTPVESDQLLKLYKQLPYAIRAAREAQTMATERPSPQADQRLRELDQLLVTILARINEILD
jgi:hypothetical protein